LPNGTFQFDQQTDWSSPALVTIRFIKIWRNLAGFIRCHPRQWRRSSSLSTHNAHVFRRRGNFTGDRSRLRPPQAGRRVRAAPSV